MEHEYRGMITRLSFYHIPYKLHTHKRGSKNSRTLPTSHFFPALLFEENPLPQKRNSRSVIQQPLHFLHPFKAKVNNQILGGKPSPPLICLSQFTKLPLKHLPGSFPLPVPRPSGPRLLPEPSPGPLVVTRRVRHGSLRFLVSRLATTSTASIIFGVSDRLDLYTSCASSRSSSPHHDLAPKSCSHTDKQTIT